MADSKVSDYAAASSINSADLLYLVQGGADKKLSFTTLLGNLPNVITKIGGVFALGGTPQTLFNTGLITATETITALSNDSTQTLTIDDGLYVGQIKVLLFTAGGNTATLSANIGVTSIAFSVIGHAVLLIWYGGSWWPIGGTATITV
jgi:hypothetical protein